MRCGLAFSITLFACSALHAAAQPSPVALEIARLRVPPMDLEAYIATKLKQQIKANGLAGSSAREVAVNKAVDAEVEAQFVNKIAPAAIEATATVYQSRYTAAELEQLRAFYATKTGQLLFGRSNSTSSGGPKGAEAAAAANSPEGFAFLKSPLGHSENSGGVAAADNAGAEAVRTVMPMVVQSVLARVAAVPQ